MQIIRPLNFLFLFLSVKYSSSQEGCTITQESYICENIINDFPSIYYGAASSLVCKYCMIEIFSESTFPYENRLKAFNLSDSGIERVTEKAFSKIDDANFIDLSNNKIHNISAGAFLGSREIRHLFLDGNQLEQLTPKFLDDYEVNTVTITRNNMKTIPARAFQGVQSLLTLDLSHNIIKHIDADAFGYLDTLEVLDLQRNLLCYMPLGTFKSLNNLRYLNLANNKFTKFSYGTFSGLSLLNYLNLANNTLNEFDSSTLLTLPRLSELDISGNGIFYFDSFTVHSNIPTLSTIQMGDNLFSCNVLTNIARYFRKVGVWMYFVNARYDVQNINGIPCSDTEIAQVVPLEIFHRTLDDEARRREIYC